MPDNFDHHTSTDGALPLNDSKYGDHRSLTYFLKTMLAECWGAEVRKRALRKHRERDSSVGGGYPRPGPKQAERVRDLPLIDTPQTSDVQSLVRNVKTSLDAPKPRKA